jgi:U32 family peptidase
MDYPSISGEHLIERFGTPTSNVVPPELLAPAGDWECARAAVENGADAIYFGLEKFNARMRAHNFTEADLPRLMEYLHGRGVKGYVTFNTLIFEDEMAEANQYLRTIIGSGVDAAIVQDVGICRLIRTLSPDFPIHASTQMTITSAGGVEFARALGCNLVVLARECSLKEIDAIAKGAQTTTVSPASTSAHLPLEVFVHGALCVAYSGQCLTSEALGGRSANRGECAQACRLPYELVADGKLVPLGARKYLLSPQDLAGLEILPELVRTGVASLKIEGRLKSPEYVASITRIYRRALDDIKLRSATDDSKRLSPKEANRSGDTQYEMEMAFSRGLYTGWFRGINNQQLVHANFGKKRGVFLGKVCEVRRDQVVILLQNSLKAGDGVVFDRGKPGEKEEGGRVYSLKLDRHSTTKAVLAFGRGDVDFARVHVGDNVWKTSDPALERRVRQSYQGDGPSFRRPISFEIHGALGKPVRVIARDESGCIASAESAIPLTRAEQQPLTDERLSGQLGRLGGTPFTLGELKNFLPAQSLLPLSELNRMRRSVVRELQLRRAKPRRWTLAPSTQKCDQQPGVSERKNGRLGLNLNVLVRNLFQLEAALNSRVATVYCDFEDPKKYHEAVIRFRQANLPSASIFVAPPRIFKMGEDWILNLVRSSGADGYLVRNYDHLRFFAEHRQIGDYTLNVANHLTATYFKTHHPLERLTASYDLNIGQLESLLRGSEPEWFEVTIHQHMPMFHMEHCVFCAFLSSGTDYTNCGRPCDTRELKLRDRVGAEHPVKADVGCRNTVYNSRAQSGAEHVSKLVRLGVRHFRLEFLNESAEDVSRMVVRYQRVLSGEMNGKQLVRELNLLNQLGVSLSQG